MYCKDELLVDVKNLSKAYKIFKTPGQRLNYYLFHLKSGRDFWALEDISFNIKRGETFGIIGKNGSGKSTLLQILAGIIKPTNGEAHVNGKISALLELGSGFNPENTGYENIYMNAAILGVTKERIEEKINEIVEFADIGDFINQPVKTYSSGMFIRLAFAVAINVDAEIILIDEALAVGDVFFRQKCYSKLNQLKKEGKTIILVTHAMNEVEQFCDRAVLIHNGKQLMLGNSKDVVQQYYMINQENKISMTQEKDYTVSDESDNTSNKKCILYKDWSIKDEQFYETNKKFEHGNGKATFRRVGIFDKNGLSKRVFNQGEEAYFYTEIEIQEDIGKPIFGVVLFDQKNNIIHGKNTLQTHLDIPDIVKKGRLLCTCIKLKLDVAIGEYTFEAGFVTMNSKIYEKRSQYTQEELDKATERLCVITNAGAFAVHGNSKAEPTKLPFHGMCNLPCEMDMQVM